MIAGDLAHTSDWSQALAESIRAQRIVRAPSPYAHSAPMHEADVADAAARILTETEEAHAGRSYELTGPASLTQLDQIEQIEQIGAAVGVSPTFEALTGQPRRTFAQWATDHADRFRWQRPCAPRHSYAP